MRGHRRFDADASVAAAVFLSAAAAYWLGRCPSFGAGDSPQHVLSALTWGVSYPVGYPLYVALGHLVSRLPGSAAGNVNGLSGLLHAGALALLYLSLRRLKVEPLPCLVALSLLAVSPLFWYFSEVAEARALNDFLAAASAYFLIRWDDAGERRALLAFAASAGLGLSHHPTFPLLAPAFAWWLWTSRRNPGRELKLFVPVLAACWVLPYLVLWLRLKASAPAYNLARVSTLGDVADLLVRRDLGGFFRILGAPGSRAGFDREHLADHLRWLARAAWDQATLLGLALAAAGLAGFRRERRAVVFWLLWLLVPLAGYVALASQQLHLRDALYERAVVARFYLLPFLGFFALAAHGAGRLLARAVPRLGWLLLAGTAVMAARRPVVLTHHEPLLEYARGLVAASAPSDILVTDMDDSAFALLYLDRVEGSLADRVVLVPSLFPFPPYLDGLAERHPDLRLPPRERVLDWSAWAALNPGRRVLDEAALRARLPRPPGLLSFSQEIFLLNAGGDAVLK